MYSGVVPDVNRQCVSQQDIQGHGQGTSLP